MRGPCSAPTSKYDLDGYNFAPTKSEKARWGPCVPVLYEQTVRLSARAGGAVAVGRGEQMARPGGRRRRVCAGALVHYE